MLAYNIIKSKMGHLGFDKLNLFTNDEIYCTGFIPSEKEVDIIGQFIKDLNNLFFSDTPTTMYITKKDGKFISDIKILGFLDPVFVAAEAPGIRSLISNLKKGILMDTVYTNSETENLNSGYVWLQ